jgi:hypothetical protein
VDNVAGAQAHLAEARQNLTQVSDPSRLSYYQALVDAIEGEVMLATDPLPARTALARAISFFHTVEPADVPRLEWLHGRANLALGDREQARLAFMRGIALLEARRDRITRDDERMSYFDDSWFLFREMVGLMKDDPTLSFSFAERGRSRALLDQLVPDSTKVATAAAITGQLEPDTALVQFAIQDDEVLAWVFRTGNVVYRQLRISEARLSEVVKRVTDALEPHARSGSLSAALTALNAVLFDSLAPALDGARRLIIVPDGPLHAVPFAALTDGRGHTLIEKLSVTIAPSASYYRAAQRQLFHLPDLTIELS